MISSVITALGLGPAVVAAAGALLLTAREEKIKRIEEEAAHALTEERKRRATARLVRDARTSVALEKQGDKFLLDGVEVPPERLKELSGEAGMIVQIIERPEEFRAKKSFIDDFKGGD